MQKFFKIKYIILKLKKKEVNCQLLSSSCYINCTGIMLKCVFKFAKLNNITKSRWFSILYKSCDNLIMLT